MSEDKLAKQDPFSGVYRARTPKELQEDVATLLAEIERLLDEESEKLRAALVLGSEVLASHQGSPQREWHSAGAWLYPGDSINVVRAPLPRNRGRAMSEDKIARAALEDGR